MKYVSEGTRVLSNHTTLDELNKVALDCIIFPSIPRADVQRDKPVIYERGIGLRLYTADGGEYLDMIGSPTRANSLGYGNHEIAQAVYEQLQTVHFVGPLSNLTEPAIRLAEKVGSLAPGDLSRIFFVSGGSEAVEAALKIAKQYHLNAGRKPRAYKTISRWNAYHGSTMGALSVSDWLAVKDIPDPRLPGHSFVPSPVRFRNPFGMDDDSYADMCATYLETQIQREGPDSVAAFIGEPIMQANGVQIPPKHYWQRVREICTKYDVLLILDEIITGFGRTGAWFACEHFEIVPDIMTVAKAMSAGYAPIGAVLTTAAIADHIPIYRNIHTFGGHAGSVAAANAAIAIKEREHLIPAAKEDGAYLLAELQNAVGNCQIVGDVRGIGYWCAIDFVANRRSRAPFGDDTVKSMVRKLRDNGILVNANGTSIEMAPALIASRGDLDQTVEAFAKVIGETAISLRTS